MSGDIDKLKRLIDRGVDKNQTDRFGRGALFYAVYSGSITVVRYLLELGLTTCIHTSTYSETHRMILLDIPDHDREAKPCMKAIELDNLPVVKLLDQHGCHMLKSFTALRNAVLTKSSEVVKYLFSQYNYQLNQVYVLLREGPIGMHTHSTRFTILEESFRQSSAVVSELLIDHGAHPDQTLIMNTFARGELKLIVLFIRTGIDVDFTLCHLITSFRGLLYYKFS